MGRTSNPSPSLYGRDGRRKYLAPDERCRFIAAALACERAEIGTLCLMLAFSGCRISEALSLTVSAIEITGGYVSIKTLKKRAVIVVREVPLPDELLARLSNVHGVPTLRPDERLWAFSRTLAWQVVKAVMTEAGIVPGPHACPKGLRHGFAVHAIRSGAPLHLVQRWLGHASLSTTAIYTQVLGVEEREIASRMWAAPSLPWH